MAACNEIIGFSPLGRSSFLSGSRSVLLGSKQNKLCFASPALLAQRRRGRLPSVKKAAATPVVATISEDVVKLVAGKQQEKLKVRAALTVRRKLKEDLKEVIVNQLDAMSDKIGRNVVLELISTEINPRTKKPKKSGETVIKDWYEKKNVKGERVVYTAEFDVDSAFGEPGAITVGQPPPEGVLPRGHRHRGVRVRAGAFPLQLLGPIHQGPSHQANLLQQQAISAIGDAVAGLKELRKKELNELRGDGNGVRKRSDRIYDYATYNDLGNPDRGIEFARPTLGGKKIPYPRRCRTGRPPTDTNMVAESRIEKPHPIYVPRDEAFEELKQGAFSAGRLKAVLHNFIPSLIASISADNHDFQGFHHIDNLYKEGLVLKLGLQEHLIKKLLSFERSRNRARACFDMTPHASSPDKFAWLRDDEFARQAVAGIDPVTIERLQAFPPVSKLDSEIYGPPESAITEAHISGQLEGLTVQQAVEEGKLFVLDFHDIYLPFIERINAMDGRKAYATRTLFFLNPIGTLKPVAIELGLLRRNRGRPGRVWC
ncbi:hypothetical protein MUK42_07522 [Musa troglodytarum]|uniref:Lipoxygenase domain-containing protein n=1 Tax=Musa troglodytarum TaxID=320322 RepID=A0A9E7IFT0_9LILI|nr:hypothetical protein MUK42_07522 [Musa troglodytarum]URE48433.1 hypothetical protein MUK42_07522 [Musa troglodytarum]